MNLCMRRLNNNEMGRWKGRSVTHARVCSSSFTCHRDPLWTTNTNPSSCCVNKSTCCAMCNHEHLSHTVRGTSNTCSDQREMTANVGAVGTGHLITALCDPVEVSSSEVLLRQFAPPFAPAVFSKPSQCWSKISAKCE